MRSAIVACTAFLFAVVLLAEPTPPTYEQLDRLIETVNKAGRGGSGSGGGTAGLVAVDGRTVTTNYEAGAVLNGTVSLVGARMAASGDIPRMGSDGALAWGPERGVLLIEGVSGATVTSAVCTNKLTFVSSPESNVKFTVTDKGGGEVEVSVGVYYK